MPARSSFDYAVIRIVPRVERQEFINAGVIVFCLEQNYLASRVQLDKERARALWPGLDLDLLERHLEAFPNICTGEPGAGPIARLTRRERFHWLVAPRSTAIQVSPVHSGLCELPDSVLDQLYRQFVLP